jgi:dissimilatory sulfite reductase (desulfoviridin) alpha/beta subunit
MPKETKLILLAVELTDAQAWHLAQFLKRVGFAEFRNNAQDDDEAYGMRDATEHLRKMLAEAGYAPR